MIIFITSSGETLESRGNPRFGRTPFFIKYDTDTKAWEPIENAATTQRGGAGVSAAQTLIDSGAAVAISGRFGPNAHQALSAGGVRMVTFNDAQKSVAAIVKDFEDGHLKDVK
jgi:predicted Fe-Mo cluster-binding NifX family protein